jgi:hypothetical protein
LYPEDPSYRGVFYFIKEYMGKDICGGRSPWGCSAEEAQALFELKARGEDIIGLINPLAVWKAIRQKEIEALLRDDDDSEDDIYKRLEKAGFEFGTGPEKLDERNQI